MRNWGIVVTAFYALILIVLAGAGVPWLADSLNWWESFGPAWIGVAAMVAGQALLLFLSVDSSFRMRRQRAHIKVTATLVGFMVAFLFMGLFMTLAVTPTVDQKLFSWLGFVPANFEVAAVVAAALLIWAAWGVVFYLYSRRSSNVVQTAVNWLITGSVLELLIVVPCHIIVRHKNDCTAPYVSAYGVASGIAVMLLAFGPSVLFLYSRKLQEYKEKAEKRA